MKRKRRVPWSVDELRIADRFVRALMRGKYATAKAAVPDCRKALARLRTGQRDAGKTAPVRSSRAVFMMLVEKARVAGRPPRRVRLTSGERRLVDRCARKLMEDRFSRIAEAARACWSEHKRRQRRGGPGWVGAAPRSPAAVYQLVASRARKLGRAPGVNAWTRAELKIIKRFAREVVAGGRRSVRAVLPVCRAELARKGLEGRHTECSIAAKLRSQCHAMGWGVQFTKWSAAENAVADRFARAVVRGHYPRATAATADCLRALGEAGLHGRTSTQVRHKLIRRTVELGRKQNYRHWSRRELDVVDRYAQGLVDGRYASVDQAAGPGRRALIASGCAERPGHGIANQLLRRAHLHGRPLRDWFWTDEELRKLDPVARDYAAYKFPNVAAAAAAGLRALGGSCPKGPRTLSGAEHAILQLARVHGRNQSWWLWSEAEIKVCDSWIRWYQRYRRVRRLRPAKVAADGLREELQYMGSERTLAACRTYFYKRRLHLLGMA